MLQKVLRRRAERDDDDTPGGVCRELARRMSDGLEVALLWYPAHDAVSVAVADAHTGHSFAFPVPRARALDAFHHPFVYAP
jgi:hypothetical protein